MATNPNVQEALNNLGQNRKMVLIGAAVVTVILTITIVFFAYSKNKSLGQQVELVKAIDQGRAFEIVSKLKASSIQTKIIDSETPGKVNITVFDKQFDDAAITLARSDLLQDEGFNLFDKSDWAASDYDKRIKKTRAINGDLSRIISRNEGVKWATVRVNIPEQQLFSEYDAPTTATVQVELEEPGARLTNTQVKSIINLLLGYIPNIKRENVSIVDTTGFTYSSVSTDEVATGDLLEESEKINKTIQKKIEDYLAPIIGQDNFIVRVSSEISREKVEKSATTFTDGAVGQEQIGDERVGGTHGNVSQVAQAGPPSPNVQAIGGNEAWARSNRVIHRYPSFEQKNIVTPPGSISNISVAVAINRGVPTRISIQQLQEGIAAITSPSTKADDVKITVAEFVTGKHAKSKSIANKKSNDFQMGGFVSDLSSKYTTLPYWARIVIGIIGIIIGLNVLGGMFAPRSLPTQSSVAQINQSRQRQFQPTPQQIPQNEAGEEEPIAEIPVYKKPPEEKPDITGVLSGLQEAASAKPEFLANRLQLWLEEGTPSNF